MWFHHSGSSMYIFLDDLPSQTGVCLNNGRRWNIAQKQVSLLVLQYEGISRPLENIKITERHWLQPMRQCLYDPFLFEISVSLSTSSMLTTMFCCVNPNCLNRLWSWWVWQGSRRSVKTFIAPIVASVDKGSYFYSEFRLLKHRRMS